MAMKFERIALDKIDMAERFRSDLGDLTALADAYKKEKILQPPGVKPVENGYELVFGGRRYEAAKLAGVEEITCRVLDGMDAYETRMVELSENIDRKQMTPLEKMKLQAEIHRLYQIKFGSGDANTPGHTIKDTAKTLGRTPASIGNDLKIYEKVSQLPEGIQATLNTVEKKSDIEKFLRDAERDAKRQIGIDKARKDLTAEGPGVKQRLIDSYRVEDFGEAEIEGPFQIVEFDPPYAIDIIELRKQSRTSTSIGDNFYTDIDAQTYIDWMLEKLHKIWTLMDDDGWLILWQSQEWMPIFFGFNPGNIDAPEKTIKRLKGGLLREVGFKVPQTMGMWDKAKGQTTNPNFVLGSSYECFIYARKGKAEIQRHVNNVFHHTGGEKLHTAQRPLSLLQDILTVFGYEGQRVLCPCAGSGITIIAAHLCQMSCEAFDIVPEFKDNFHYLVQKHIQ